MLQWTEHPIREKGMTITVDEVKGFLKKMDEDDEFDAFNWISALSLPLLVASRERAEGLLTRASMTSSEGVALACDPCASGSLVALPKALEQLAPGVMACACSGSGHAWRTCQLSGASCGPWAAAASLFAFRIKTMQK